MAHIQSQIKGGYYPLPPDRARWTNLISLAVEREELTWPGEEQSEAAKRLTNSDAMHDVTLDIATQRY